MILKYALVVLLAVSFATAMIAMCVLLYSFIMLLSTFQAADRSRGEKLATTFLPLLLFTPAFQPLEKHKYIKRFGFSLIVFLVAFGIGQLILAFGKDLT